MVWQTVTRQVYKCDLCRETVLTDPEFGGELLFEKPANLHEYDINESMWREIYGKYYCSNCWHWCQATDNWDEIAVGNDEYCYCRYMEAWESLLH